MASSKEYLTFVLEQIADPANVSARPMMGEYVVYYRGKTVGGVYDDRFLVKMTKSALKLLDELGVEPQTEIPYPGAKEMLAVDIDDAGLTRRLIAAVADDLPEPKLKKKGGR